MIAVTSISPTHINAGIQSKAVQSWIDCGMKVYSINCKEECEQLKPLYPDVTFIPTHQTMEQTFKRPYVRINAVLDWAKDQSENHFCIINSDIELKINNVTLIGIENEMEKSIVMSNRVNHNGDYIGAQYLAGIDVFFIHKKWLSYFSQTIFCFGQCFWDYWIPYSANEKGIDTTFVKQNISYHLNHPAQYKHEQWLQTGRYFLWEHGLSQFNSTLPSEVGKANTYVYNYIYTNSKRKEL